MRPSRHAAQAAASRILAQASDESTPAPPRPARDSRRASTRRPRQSASPPAPFVKPERGDDDDEPERPVKRRKVASNAIRSAELHETLFGQGAEPPATPCPGSDRRHVVTYHRPLLLDDGEVNRDALLAWFDATSTTRKMPWRKPFLDPALSPRDVLERRAYEVWISEIMLQQTRVAVVIDYWNRWMEKWPTIQDLAAADADEVLLAWRGLGYYSRARRIHEAARIVVGDPELKGLLPADTKVLEARVPGVGRYTAGAIASIVFGRAVPMVDGNVLRVLSRQMGVYGNVKSDKAVIDVMWAAADALVKAAADDGAGEGSERASDVPGRWGQALMELGSTLCTPKPDCGSCPISATCRAYNEGLARAREPSRIAGGGGLRDIEDACTICEPFEDSEGEVKEEAGPDISAYFTKKTARNGTTRKNGKAPSPHLNQPSEKPTPAEISIAIDHARKFPLKVVKKAVREEETLVCAIRGPDGRYLIHRRPEKGLLAGLWELPSQILPKDAGKASARKAAAVKYVEGLRVADHAGMGGGAVRHVGDLGAVPWLFSHLKLTMHVHVFALGGDGVG
ncbi:A/G-specific adenine glycosylase, partial [Candidatus Bathyarchaeota archaeon]|nr:A/G-specific adenine glycosylase [Candidatus Bathyarchaeota archaeon]